MDCSPPGSSVPGISQATILEGVAMPSSEDLPDSGIDPESPALWADSLPSEPPENPLSSLTRDQTHATCSGSMNLTFLIRGIPEGPRAVHRLALGISLVRSFWKLRTLARERFAAQRTRGPLPGVSCSSFVTLPLPCSRDHPGSQSAETKTTGLAHS